MILSYKMNQFHFCTWSSISHFVTYASLTAFFSVFQQPCANKGHCVLNNANSYTCICRPGWSGQHCRINVNDCVQHWCQNGATCVDEIDGYRWVLKSQLSTEKKKKQDVNDCKSCDIYCFLQGWRNSSHFIQYQEILFNLLLAAFVPEDTQASTVKRTLIIVLAIAVLNMGFAWTSSITSPAAAWLDLKGRSVNWKQMSATASPVQAAPPVWT